MAGMKRTFRRLTCSVMAVVVLSACGGLPTAPAYPKKADGFSVPQDSGRTGIANDPAMPLTLQPGDLLTVELASEQSRSLEGLAVDATGNIHLPLAGDVDI